MYGRKRNGFPCPCGGAPLFTCPTCGAPGAARELSAPLRHGIPDYCGIDIETVIADCRVALRTLHNAGGSFDFPIEEGIEQSTDDLLARLDEIAAAVASRNGEEG